MNSFFKRTIFTRTRLAVALMLLIHVMLMAHSAAQKSATVDELSHLAAGLYSFTTLDFRVNRVDPPLQNVLCAATAWFTSDIVIDFDNENWRKGIWNGAGDRLVEANPETFHSILQRGRVASMAISALLCLAIFIFAKELWGTRVGLCVFAIAVFEPNLLAHGRLITTDAATTLFFLLTGYFTWRFLRTPSWPRLAPIGVAFGCAWLNKHSGIVIAPALLLIFWAWREKAEHSRLIHWPRFESKALRTAWRSLVLTTVACAAALLTIWAGFAFEVGNTIEDFSPQQSALWQEMQIPLRTTLHFVGLREWAAYDPTDPNNRLWRLIDAALPAFSHWEGFFKVRQILKAGHRGYLMGAYSNHGFPLFYPVLFLIKTTLVALAIILGGAILLAARQVQLERNAALVLLIPLIYLLVLVFFNTAAIGYRHALPALPYLLIFFGGAFFYALFKAADLFPHKRGWLHGAAAALILLNTVDSVSTHPHYLCYFNALIGGPKNGHWYAVDSSLDWGQDLLILKRYIEENDLEEINLIYFGPPMLPNAYGVPHREVSYEEPLAPGVYVVGASALHGIGAYGLYARMQAFREREPDVYITPALFLYRHQP